jgi:hypothetical protein
MSETVEGFTHIQRTARQQHTCKECRQPIVPGEVYHYMSGICDNAAFSVKMCEQCHRVMEHVHDRLGPDEMVEFGQLSSGCLEFSPTGPHTKKTHYEVISNYAKCNMLEVDSIEKRLARAEQAAKKLAEALVPFKDAQIGAVILTQEQAVKIQRAFAAHGSWACPPELSSVGDTCNTASAG